MGIDLGFYEALEFSKVYEHKVGGVTVLVGRLTQESHLGPVVYAAALDALGLGHRRPQPERGFGPTRAAAVAALFNRMH